jgi:glutaredoxin
MYTSNHCPYCSNAEQLLKNKGVTVVDKLDGKNG